MNKKKSAQVSMEFLVVFSIILIIFIITSFFLYQKVTQANEIKVNIAGKKISNSIAESINEVFIVGEGFSKILELPEKIFFDNYLVKFYSQEPSVFVFTERLSWSSPLSTPEINCTMSICSYSNGVTTINVVDLTSTLKIRIVNKDEKIYLEDV